MLENITAVFQSLQKRCIVAFPSLEELHLHCTGWSSITPPNRRCAFALAAISQPSLCYWPFIFSLDELPSLPLQDETRPENKIRREGKEMYRELKFAQGHIPDRVIHVPYKVPCIPSVCYGTLNVVSYSQLWSHPAWSVDETIDYLISVLRYAHPEVFNQEDDVVQRLDQKEKHIRDKTLWAFLWVGRFTKKEGKTYGTMMKLVEVGLYEAVPCMKDRVKFCVRNVEK